MSEPNSNAWPFTEISGEEGLDINAIFGDSTGATGPVKIYAQNCLQAPAE